MNPLETYTRNAADALQKKIDEDILKMLMNQRRIAIYGNIRPHRKRTWRTVEHRLPVPVKNEKDLRSYARHIKFLPLVQAIQKGDVEKAKELAKPFLAERFSKVDCLRVRRVVIE